MIVCAAALSRTARLVSSICFIVTCPVKVVSGRKAQLLLPPGGEAFAALTTARSRAMRVKEMCRKDLTPDYVVSEFTTGMSIVRQESIAHQGDLRNAGEAAKVVPSR